MKPSSTKNSLKGFLQLDLIAGLAILTIAIIPVGFSFARERTALKIEYQRAVINELVDGEMEILASGAAKEMPDVTQTLTIQSKAISRLPAGHFQFTKQGSHLRLVWQAYEKCGISPIARETTLK